MILENKRLTGMVSAAVVLLAIPFIAMQFTAEVAWTASDFVVMGILLFGTVALIEMVLRKVRKKERRILWIALVLFGLILLWAELAVGIFGSPLAGS